MGLRRPRPPATAWGRAFEVAFEAALAVVLGVAIGVYLDNRFETGPLFLFLFLALGFATSIKRLLSIRWPDPPSNDGSRDGGEKTGK